jgi:ribonuclease HI
MLTVVISVDGAARGNHDSTVQTRTAWGVYFGPGCQYNNAQVNDGHHLRSGGAELEAVRQGLLAVLARRRAGELDGFREIIIKLDSDYAAKTFDQYVWGWAKKGWKKHDGTEPVNLQLVKNIHFMICAMEQDNMAVRFWVSQKSHSIQDVRRLI